MVEQERINENSKYGQFIIQTSEVQLYLGLLIFLRSPISNKKLKKYLERLQMGNLIGCFRICVKNPFESSLVDSLENYKDSRNTLAHKMFSDQKLTPKECKLSIELGDALLEALKKLLKDETDKFATIAKPKKTKQSKN